MASIAATPAPLSQAPGADKRVPCRSAAIGVPAGKTVSMCADSNTRRAHDPCAGHLAMALPTSSMYGFSSPSSRKRSHSHSARAPLAKRRSRHRHHLRLPLQDALLLQVQPLECLVHAAVGREPGDTCGCGRGRSHRRFQRSIPRRPRRGRLPLTVRSTARSILDAVQKQPPRRRSCPRRTPRARLQNACDLLRLHPCPRPTSTNVPTRFRTMWCRKPFPRTR